MGGGRRTWERHGNANGRGCQAEGMDEGPIEHDSGTWNYRPRVHLRRRGKRKEKKEIELTTRPS